MCYYEMTEEIILAKKSKGLSWDDIASKLGAGTVWITSCCFGMNRMSKEHADALCSMLGLSDEISEWLQEFPNRTWEPTIPQDPLIYRFYEIVGSYGETLKEVIQEKFGYGIMSAIDFNMKVDKEENPKGDRVVVTMNGKFLPYTSW